MDKCMEKIFQGLLADGEEEKRLVSSPEYMEWLYEFTRSRGYFDDHYWAYGKEATISDEDYKQIGVLTQFYNALAKYHAENWLQENIGGGERWYNVEYKDAYFAIGVCVGQGGYNFVKRYTGYDEMMPLTYVDFEDVMNNVPVSDLELKKAKLQEFETIASEMRKLNIPRSVVYKALEKAFNS